MACPRFVRYLPILLSFALPMLGCNDSALSDVAGHLVFDPPLIDRGDLVTGEPALENLRLINEGGLPIEVTSLEVADAESGVEIAELDPAVTFPFMLEGRAAIDITLALSSDVPGAIEGSLIATPARAREAKVEALVRGRASHEHTQQIEPGNGNAADLLFVVDNSDSMYDDQKKLGKSFKTFIQWISGHSVSFQIGVTTTDTSDPSTAGALIGMPSILSNATPDLETTFESRVNVGINGSATERGLDAAVAALSHPSAAGLVRDQAKLFLIFVSDENDYSLGKVSYYEQYFPLAKSGKAEDVDVVAIVPDAPNGCGGLGPGTRYVELVNNLSGLFGSICVSDFGVHLKNLALRVIAPAQGYVLEFVPDPQTIRVSVGGTLADPSHFAFDAAQNSVVFGDAHVPAPGSAVEIVYTAVDVWDAGVQAP